MADQACRRVADSASCGRGERACCAARARSGAPALSERRDLHPGEDPHAEPPAADTWNVALLHPTARATDATTDTIAPSDRAIVADSLDPGVLADVFVSL